MRFIARYRAMVWVVAGLSGLAFAPASSAQTPSRSPQAGRANAAAKDTAAVTPFKIQVGDAVLTDVKQRLSRARFADEFPDAGWDYGTNLAYLQQLVAYWKDKYDWRAQERRLNQFDQFKTNIDGLDIHFIHQRAKSPNARPLLLLNGWPSSIVEYVKVIGPLSDPAAHGGRSEDAFHVVIPSMPGYGFSDKPRARGYDPARMAGIWTKLMARLGYEKYIAHGSDWGIAVATHLALQDPAHMAALHLAGCPGGPIPGPPQGTAPSQPVPISSNLGYQEIQTTKPQTLGQGLADSPLGLASWIIDKWHSWSDHDGDVESVYSKDDLITNVMIYWITNTGTSSARLYYETRHLEGRLLPNLMSGFLPRLPEGRVTVPTGCGVFPSQYDRRGLPPADPATARRSADVRYHVVHYATMPRGGHFPALEQPAAWVDDLRAFRRAQP